MAVLPTLYPQPPDGTVTTMAAPVGYATYAEAMQVNDGDTSYITSGLDSAGSVFVNLDDMPADFGGFNSVSISCVVRLFGTQVDDTTALYAQVFAADEVTPLTGEVFVTDHSTGPTYTIDATNLDLSSAGLNEGKATWDGAKLRLRWEYIKSGKSDGIDLRVTQSYLDGDYWTVGPATHLAAMAVTGTATATILGERIAPPVYGTLNATATSTWAIVETIVEAPQSAIPGADLENTGFVTEAGLNTGLFQSINETSPNDSDFIKTNPSGPGTFVYEADLTALEEPLTRDNHMVKYRLGAVGEGDTSITVHLRQGLTTIASWTHTGLTDFTTFSRVLTTTEAQSITDYNDLRLRFEASVTAPVAANYLITEGGDSILTEDGNTVTLEG